MIIFFAKNIQLKTNKEITNNPLSGTWVDEFNNYYEIKDEVISINRGQKNLPFMSGVIDDIVEFNGGYKLFISATTYDISDGIQKNPQEQTVILKISDYTDELKKAMICNLGESDFSIIRVEK